MSKIYVIIPVYNVKPYLAECLDSVMAQTYKNIVPIAVDDGSTDGCAELLDDYAARHPRLQVVHQANGGLSAARNTGLDLAYGEMDPEEDNYIGFVDSDDYIAPDMYEKLLGALKRDRADIACCDVTLVDAAGKRTGYAHNRLAPPPRDFGA